MAHPVWTPSSGTLGIIPENNFFQLELSASDPEGGVVAYKFLAGQMPGGMYVTRAGSFQGVPIVTDATTTSNLNRSYIFTVRASDINNLVTDKTFSITVSNITPPQILPNITKLPDIFDGSFYNLQLQAIEVNPQATLTWRLINGTLPNGLSISSTGLISGFIIPLPTLGNSGLQNYGVVPYNEFGYDNQVSYQNNNYTFTVQVYDGANYNSITYSLYVVAKDHWEADTALDSVDSGLTVDQDNRYLPIMITQSQNLPAGRSHSKFAFQFQAIDPNDEALQYSLYGGGAASGFDGTGYDTTGFDQSTLALPGGLSLDPNTGWLSGTLGSQSEATKTYTFKIYAYERDNPSYASIPQIYYLTVLGDITNTINWITSPNLGIIDNGSVSELSVSAKSNAGKSLVYSIVTDQTHLPQGLQLLPSGLISGRCTFEYYSLDQNTTVIDGNATTFDNTYKFTVMASSTDNTASSTQTFTISINNFNKIPYENLYLKALPTIDQRQTFLSIVNNKEIFPTNLIYRPTDPWFGRATDIRSLFLAGLNPAQIGSFTSAMANNTYNKRIEFSDIKTAYALDANFNVKYEVVYLDLIDAQTYKGRSPANVEYDEFISANVYPNSINNMASTVVSTIGYANQGAIPDWMTSPQANKKQLGFTRAVVLAYTIPGASALIAYRLKANGIVFNSVDFVADRYDLDNSMSSNYISASDRFIVGYETTFDCIKRPASVSWYADYGVSNLAFDMINNCTVAQIQASGGIDGINYFTNGQTLIFLRQENFPGETTTNDGWNLVTNSGTTVVPGYLDHLLNPAIANQRAGIWRINISNSNLVTLTFVQVVAPAQYVQINYGASQNNVIVYYDPSLQSNHSVLSYIIAPNSALNGPGSNTRFDNYGTRFINNRTVIASPESGDTYLKFPKMGEIQ